MHEDAAMTVDAVHERCSAFRRGRYSIQASTAGWVPEWLKGPVLKSAKRRVYPYRTVYNMLIYL